MKKILIVSLMAILLLTLTACGKGGEKDRFVNATVEVGCAMFQDENFFKDLSNGNEKTKEIFAKYDFNIEGDEAMNKMSALSLEYQKDPEVVQKIKDGITKCAGNTFNQKVLEKVAAEEATKTTETPVVTETK